MAKNPINSDALKKLLDTVTPMSPEAAERFVRELVRIGEERRKDAERVVAEVSAAGRRSAEHFTSAVQQEVAKQLGRLVQRIDSLERQLEHVNRNLETTRTAVATAASKAVARALPGGTSVPPTKKKSNGKKSGTAKNGAGKSAQKKAATKSTASKKSGSTKNGSSKGGKKKAVGATAPVSGGSTASSVV